MTLFTAGALTATFLGRVVRWETQDRDDRQVSWREAFRLQGDAVVIGVLMSIGFVAAGDLELALWMAPLALALLTSPAQSVWTSRSDLGRLARAHGLFLTPDDTARPVELTELAQMRGIPDPARPAVPRSGLRLAVADDA